LLRHLYNPSNPVFWRSLAECHLLCLAAKRKLIELKLGLRNDQKYMEIIRNFAIWVSYFTITAICRNNVYLYFGIFVGYFSIVLTHFVSPRENIRIFFRLQTIIRFFFLRNGNVTKKHFLQCFLSIILQKKT